MENHKIELNCKGKCPKCDNGELLPFVRAIPTKGASYGRGAGTKFDHYEVYYRCDHCNFILEEDTFIEHCSLF
jgi:rubredoxin